MLVLPPITLRLRGWKLIDRVALAFLLLCSIALGAAVACSSSTKAICRKSTRLETYRPTVVTEIYADDGQLVGSFALQRRILMTWEQTPKILYNAVCAIEDQHFEDHWGVDFPRVAGAAYRNILKRRKAEGASTITMQLAGNLFLDRSDRSFRRKAQEMLLGLQIERRYTKPQIFTMYANQVYLAHGNYGFAAASEFYFGKSGYRSQFAGSRTACGNGQRSKILAAEQSHGSADSPQSGASSNDGGRQNIAGRRSEAPENLPSVCTSNIRATIWRRTSSKRSANIWNPPMARKPFTNAACAFTPR